MTDRVKILQDVEDARLMVITWRRDRYEKQVARAAVTLTRMREARMWRMLVYKLQAMSLQSVYWEDISIKTLRPSKTQGRL